ncbi:Tetratricopeptide repeat-containing protein [Palleronia salina]|uniref:Tetratricopeptide repeat-containing protein n=2 Tax=Palleronia TaxID=315422 RepID=A0A1M6JCT1_9RHOB|nr:MULTISPECIES: tetratricopeptide repeat protein [Palleronia]SEN96413.1 Tetratricopeptide repeat-containing protein [Palleronia pelagia]SHJ44525.1 Tetratricopeptide repeat-containing protein [Palleronia salina]
MQRLKSAVAAFMISLALPAAAQDGVDDLFTALATAEGTDAERIADKILTEWSQSGSPAMDVLLTRGRDAMEEGNLKAAVMHLSALVDHAPDFAEGYHARATAYFQQRRLGLAMSDLEATLSLNPRHFGALSGLGIILADLDQPDLALRAWREVVELYPGNTDAQAAIDRLELLAEGQTL